MNTAARAHEAPVSHDTRATLTLGLLAVAALLYFMLPAYFVMRLDPIPWPLVLGGWSDPAPTSVDGWRDALGGQLRHLRYEAGGTCTQYLAGDGDTLVSLVVEACR